MKSAILATLAILAFAGCATAPTAPTAPPGHRVGATSGDVEWLPASSIPAITGTSATIVLFSMTNGRAVTTPGLTTTVNRVGVSVRCDQPVTLLYQVERSSGGAVFRTMNGNGSGDSVLANTDTFIDYLIMGPTSRIEAVTGSPGPSACETDIGLFVDRQTGI
jgi:hypothetical protein